MLHLRQAVLTNFSGKGTARMKRTAFWHVRKHRHVAFDCVELIACIVELGDGCDKTLGIGMQRTGKQLIYLGIFHRMPRIHHEYPIGHLTHHAHIVCDEHHRGTEFCFHAVDELQNLCLYGHIERGCRLIANQEVRIGGKCHRNHDTLTHTTRKFMRIGTIHLLGCRNTYKLDHFECARRGRFL